jgi:hypothetical protein
MQSMHIFGPIRTKRKTESRTRPPYKFSFILPKKFGWSLDSTVFLQLGYGPNVIQIVAF